MKRKDGEELNEKRHISPNESGCMLKMTKICPAVEMTETSVNKLKGNGWEMFWDRKTAEHKRSRRAQNEQINRRT